MGRGSEMTPKKSGKMSDLTTKAGKNSEMTPSKKSKVQEITPKRGKKLPADSPKGKVLHCVFSRLYTFLIPTML